MKLDYEELGLKVGFEIHQELDTNKLFCECPSILKDEDPQVTVDRELRPTESELGEIDRAALAEEAKSKKFRYEVHPDSVCLVELDEEPPHLVNEEAIEIALEASLLLDANPADEAHVMRKTVIDGSNTAGFQRTILIATDGVMKINGNEISLPTICLEEDAARKIDETSEYVTYRLDRLGIPLLEIATGPDFNDPETPVKAAEKIGKMLRATGNVKRGIGTIRQDVNVSIEKGARQEIKGVQELSLIKTVIEREAQRQVKLLEIKEELEKRNASKVEGKIVDVTNVFSNTDSKILDKAISNGGGVFAVKLEGLSGLLGKELIPDHRFGTELSDYAKVYGKVDGIFHTDELPSYGITEEEVNRLEDEVGALEDDAVVIIADNENKSRKGLEAVIDRVNKAFDGVPEETRRALSNGNTQYMRPLPGSARMYVETDVPPVKVTEDRIREIRKELPERPSEKKQRYEKEFNLSEELAKQLSISDKASFFEEIIEEYNVDPTLVASTLEQTLAQLERENVPVENITNDSLREVFGLIEKGEISKDAVLQLLEEVGKGFDVKEAVEKLGISKMEEDKVSKIVSEVVEEKEDLILERGETAINALMGVVMQKIGGKADGKKVHKLLEKKIKEKLN
ncbi:glutamyl-tRNA amidotransferase [candidate division MSBL1 archaeon SCGC-AAA382A13]|uniref:Glutamyl-tRNA(Gln) amidotransferase subunit E n=1 Tax=candidate division MSBL1 archaeon SCGC-AAA382A13 TaxID=1698279 RepID=A0A133VD10_9EURY|nr:glutamyl-tRNA amidotransferase [candidate division MSBL1 archaeon SCGC-AAA382A13]